MNHRSDLAPDRMDIPPLLKDAHYQPVERLSLRSGEDLEFVVHPLGKPQQQRRLGSLHPSLGSVSSLAQWKFPRGDIMISY